MHQPAVWVLKTGFHAATLKTMKRWLGCKQDHALPRTEEMLNRKVHLLDLENMVGAVRYIWPPPLYRQTIM